MSTPDPMLRCTLCGARSDPGELVAHVAAHETDLGITRLQPAPSGVDGQALDLVRLYAFYEENRERIGNDGPRFEVRTWVMMPATAHGLSCWTVAAHCYTRDAANMVADGLHTTTGRSVEVWTIRQALPRGPARMLCDRHGPEISQQEQERGPTG